MDARTVAGSLARELTPGADSIPYNPPVAEDKGKEEEKFDFTPEGEGYISLDEARVLAMWTALESPGNYGRGFRRATTVFEVVEATETDEASLDNLNPLPYGVHGFGLPLDLPLR